MSDQKQRPAQREMSNLDPKPVSEEKANDVRGGAKAPADLTITKRSDKSTP